MNQPEAIVPTTSKTPITASSEAAAVTGIPWSCAAGTKCVWTRPFVDAPQIAKVPASSQKGPVRAAENRTVTARLAAPGTGSGLGTNSFAPYGRRPTSAGWSRSSSQTKGTTARAASATVTAAGRQSCSETIQDRRGRKISCPEADAAVRMPVTRPRRSVNQRLVTVAAKASAIEPEPRPTSSPQHSSSCQAAVIHTVAPEPSAITARATATTRRMPKRSISAAANGAVRPYSARLTETAAPIVPRDQSNSSCSGSMSRPGSERKAAAPMIVTKVTAATNHARCTRGPRTRRGPGPWTVVAAVSVVCVTS